MVKMETLCNDMEKYIDETTDISKLLKGWEVFNNNLKRFEELNEKLKSKIKNHLKERNWKHYFDNKTKISITISKITRENIDKNQLKILLTNSQYSQVINTITYERLQILTEKKKKELRKIVGK